MTTSDITFPADGGRPMRAAYAAPSDAQKHPGVIVIHEIFGLNDDIRRITGMVADLGYAALAPDLYDRDGMRILCIARTMMTLNRGEGDAFNDLDAARKFLQQQPGVDAARIGVIGFCMGGGFALMFAARAPIGVAATFYGDVPKTTEQLRGVCPVLGGYGGQDRMFAAHGRRLEKLLTEMGVDHDVKIYEDAGHSFMSRNSGFLASIGKIGPMKVAYNPQAAEDSWKRIEAFFGRHLGH
ncbi:dienelactone hydrolase family protein [Candidatus Binatus soli]|jgi:carboxymethylenebutenolidase|uniref:dienelactone hydrolase family protein n=1 Tax=Candidatus Binatus soli TaxID=1953413 RepID=UPI003D0C347F